MSEMLEAAWPVGAGNLKKVLQGLSTRFYTLEEFPTLKRETLPEGILDRAMALPELQIKSFGAGLKGKELEGLILDLRDTEDPDRIYRGCQILAQRSTKRILKLLTILYQYNYSSHGLNTALHQMAEQLQRRGHHSPEEAFVWHLGLEEKKMPVVSRMIEENENSISACFKALNISEMSPFAKETAYLYLTDAPREGFKVNTRWLVATIQERWEEELKKVVRHYLESFQLHDYQDGVNLEILKKLGRPYDSMEWDGFSKEIKDRFTQWHYLHRLRIHSMQHPKKYIILSKYLLQVVNSYELRDEELMVIDFGDIVLADVAGSPYSFFYEKEAFEKEMTQWEISKREAAAWEPDNEEDPPKVQIPTFLRKDKDNRTARDFIIEEVEEACVKLSYEGIDILYIDEMLDIKMGLEPDLRRKQLAKLKKR